MTPLGDFELDGVARPTALGVPVHTTTVIRPDGK
jgi:hypothetical protein